MLLSKPEPILTASDPEQVAIRCLFMRGGSSRGGFFLEEELPADPVERGAVLLACYGSPDGRQIDGIGGADPLTSKAAVVGRSARPDADLDYTFYQVGIDRPKVSTGGNCGNMLAGVGPYALLRGIIQPQEPETAVRIYTTNTGQVVTARIQVSGAFPRVTGGATVAGVPGTGSPIAIDFGNCAGSVCGRLLPTHSPRDRIRVGEREFDVSFVDAATPFVFVAAQSIGATGVETPAELIANTELMNTLEGVRGWAATVLGFVDEPAKARMVTPNVPRVIMISAPQSYRTVEGGIAAEDVDLCVRQLAMQKPHNTLAVTGAVCTAVAAKISGSLVNELARPTDGVIRLGHPAGVLEVSAEVIDQDGQLEVRSAAVLRTARVLMSGEVFVPRERIEQLKAIVEVDSPKGAPAAD